MKQLLLLIAILFVSSNWSLAQKHYFGCQHSKQTQFLKLSSKEETTNQDTKGFQEEREDSLDVLHYHILLDITDFSSRIIEGSCLLQIKTKLEGVSGVTLDLEELLVDKVEVNGQNANFSQNSPKLEVEFPQFFSSNETVEVQVFYAGRPNNTSFGGFYFSTNYAYNMGVGIGVDPPNYGRAWFPCFDSFTERSTYEFHITTLGNHKAFCNGLLEGFTVNENETKTWHWKLNQTIPTYLAAIAVSDYETIESTHEGAYDPILVQLAARAADTSNLKNSFILLPDAIDAFEAAYGKHRFDRIGFNVVPFGGGAMEHATNIAYPSFAVDGTLVFEDLMAHEFGHHWWGDLVTCETADDMWLNEGWASYSENLFMEAVYGREAYLDAVTFNQIEVMQYAHIQDGAHYPVSGVPFDVTYGRHVYNKGADVAHTLRGYMGDEAFFRCIREYLSAFAFQTANSEQFRDFLSECSGFDLDDFFDDWVFGAGYPQFDIDSLVVGFDGNPFTADVYIRQKLYGTDDLFENVPMDITFYDTNLHTHTEKVWLAGECAIHSFDLPFYPVLVVLDKDSKISDAMTPEQQMISQTGVYDFPDAKMEVTVNQIQDSTLLRVTHHWAAPDRMANAPEGLIFSPNRYWKVEGIRYNLFLASAKIDYNGSASLNGGFLDNDLISGSENSLQVFFRSNSAEEWQQLTGTNISQDIQGNTTDRRGSFTIHNLQFGEYTLAFVDNNRTDPISTSNPECALTDIEGEVILEGNPHFEVFPNPIRARKNQLTVRFLKTIGGEKTIRLYDLNGALVKSVEIGANQLAELNLKGLQQGLYVLQVLEEGKLLGVESVVVL